MQLAGTEADAIGNEQAALIPAIIVGYLGEGRTLKGLYDVLAAGDKTHPDWKYISLLKRCSPITYAKKGGAPILLLHGNADTVVPPEQSQLLYRALVDKGADATLVMTSQGSHGPSLGEEVDQFAYRFLKERL